MSKNLLRRMGHLQSGNILVLVTIFIVTLFAFAALSIDVANVFFEQRRAQSGTDAAALAGVVLLTNSTPTAWANAAKTEARTIALANGVTDAEIAASSITAIEVGYWDTNTLTFTAGTLTSPNAVSVPARRNVSLSFAGLVGISQMTPAVRSVASFTGTGSTTSGDYNLIPYGLGSALLAGKTYGDTITTDGFQESGNWGKLNFGGTWADNMTDGATNVISVGQSIRTITGVAKAAKTFDKMVGETVIIPIADVFGNGAGSVNIVGFVVAKIINSTGNGNNLDITFQLIKATIGGNGGGPGTGPFATSRVLVK